MRQPKEGEGREDHNESRGRGGNNKACRIEIAWGGGGIEGDMRENEMRFNYGCEKGDGEGSPPPPLRSKGKNSCPFRFTHSPPHRLGDSPHFCFRGEVRYDMKFVPFYG